MNTQGNQSQPTAEQIDRWFKQRFGDKFVPTDEQNGWVKENWGRENVPKEEWEHRFPPIEQEVEGVKYVLEHGHYGVFASEEALPLQEWWKVKKRKEFFTSVFDIPEPEWLVEGFAVKEGITLLYGDRATGKTSLMLQLIASAWEGKDLLSLKVKQVRPLFIEQDENPAMLRGHIERMLPKYDSLERLELPNDRLLWDNQNLRFAVPGMLELLISLSRANLVIIDSLTSMGIDDINHPRSAIVFDRLRDVAREWQCAFIVIHHPNKSGEIMGSNMIPPKTDIILYLEIGKLSFEKLRGQPPSIARLDQTYPYMKIKQDEDTLVFRIDRADFIRKLIQEKKLKPEIVGTVQEVYGGERDAVRKAVGREMEKIAKKGKS